MGVTMSIRSANDATIDALAKDSAALERYLNTISQEKVAQIKAALGTSNDPRIHALLDQLKERVAPEGIVVHDLDLDKTWHGLHYLLTGTAEDGERPYNYLLKTDRPLASERVQAHAVSSDEVKKFHQALQKMDRTAFLSRYDGKKMEAEQVYPPGLWEGAVEDDFDFLYEQFEKLRHFLEVASSRDEGMIVWIMT